MLVYLFNFFYQYFHLKIFYVFNYFSTRMILASLFSLFFSLFFTSKWISMLQKKEIHENLREEKEVGKLAHLHSQKKGTPTMGGVPLIFAILFSAFFWMDLTHVFSWILIFSTIWLGSIGFIDDFLKYRRKNSQGLAGKKKLFLQLLLGTLVFSYLLCPSFSQFVEEKTFLKAPFAKEKLVPKKESIQKNISTKEMVQRINIPFLKKPIVVTSSFLIFLFFLVVLLGSSNAVNLTDGLDGLASGLIIQVSFILACVAFVSNHLKLASYLNILYIEGSGEIAIFLFALCGATLGFLWFNCHPAQVFLGDTGSLTLGGILGISAILLRRELLFALIGGLFVIEALSVILQVVSFKIRKKRIFLCSPLHHHFEYLNWPESKVVIRFWIVGLIFALLGIASLKFQ